MNKSELFYKCPVCNQTNLTRTWSRGDYSLPDRDPFNRVMGGASAAFGYRKCKFCKAGLVVIYNGSSWRSNRFSSAYSKGYDHGIFTEGMKLLGKKVG